MSKLLYNGVELPPVPAHDADATVEVISAVLPAALSMYAQSPYILVIGKGTLWQGGKCYVRGVSAVYRLSGDAWMWHYGSGTVSAQDIVAANYFEAIWTNTDIPTADGAGIYLAASAPVDPNAPDEPEPEEPPVEPNVDVAAIYRRGWMDGFLSGINIRGILHRRKVEEPQPVTAYLYGTPSPTIVTYNGVELPELPEWDKSVYPYVYITKNSSGVIRILCSYIPLEYGTYNSGGTDYTKIYLNIPKGKISTTWNFDFAENAWGEGYERSWDRTGDDLNYKLTFAEVLWCNTDIPNLDNNTTYLAASEPVYSQAGGNVALADGEGYVLYDGAVLPPLPESDLPYASIYMHVGISLTGEPPKTYFLVLSDVKTYRKATTGLYPEGDVECNWCRYKWEENAWTVYDELKFGTFSLYANGGVIWGNHDIPCYDGTADPVSASDPIPLASAEPVAAVYGGTKLPVLPEWDKETYPNAMISVTLDSDTGEIDTYGLRCTQSKYPDLSAWNSTVSEPYVAYASNFGTKIPALQTDIERTAAMWGDLIERTLPASTQLKNVIWSSIDLYFADGVLGFAASAPVPIYKIKE